MRRIMMVLMVCLIGVDGYALSGIDALTTEMLRTKSVRIEESHRRTMMFIYSSTCPYCHQAAPILKKFAQAHAIDIIPLSLDGNPLPEFPTFLKDEGESKRLNVKAIPSIFLISKKYQKAIPISIGMIDDSTLENRLFVVEQELDKVGEIK